MRGCETWSPASKQYTLHISENKMLITVFVNNSEVKEFAIG